MLRAVAAADPLAALTLWHFDPLVIGLLGLIGGIYLRGWLRVRRHIRYPHDARRLGAFLGGLVLLFIAGESPLDAFDATYVSAHMTQHLILMMLAPGLILLGNPLLPMLRGLPRTLVRGVVGPFLAMPELRRFSEILVAPPIALAIYALSTFGWHTPYLYELALSSPVWHGAEHASFFWTGFLFWWPVIQPDPSRSRWPAWIAIPYLLIADLVNTVLSAIFIFSGKLLYPSYAALHGLSRSPLEDQVLAGAIMWVPGSIVYLVPAVAITIRLLSPARVPAGPSVMRRA